MALAGSSLGHQILELNAALYIALNEPDAGDRWLAGDDVFGEAALDPTDPAQLALQPWTWTF